MTTDLSHRAFRAHAAQQLASSATLRNSVLHQLYSRLSHRTMTTIDAATLRFAYAPGEEPFLIVGYRNQATIALPQYWMELSELCWETVFVCGISHLQIVGKRTGSYCRLGQDGKWIREALR